MNNASILLRLAERRQRAREIIGVLTKYGLAEYVSPELLASLERVLRGRLRMTDPTVSRLSTGERIRAALTELGTAWIKLGQLLSLRPDVVGQTIAAELGLLESQVTSDSPGTAVRIVERELGAPISELFKHFEPAARAAASVAQVHDAVLHDGTEVVVKIVHQGSDVRAAEDLEIMTALAQLWEHNDPRAKQYRSVQIVHQLSTMVKDAMDMRTELASLTALGKRLAHHRQIYIPEPVEHLTSHLVLTMTRVDGRPLRQITDVEDAGWNVEELTHTVVALYFEMIFEHGMFHADPHPGNFVLMDDGRLGILDFGDIGRFTAARREQMERMVMALALRDADEFSRVLIEVSDPPAAVEMTQLRIDLGSWFDRYIDVGVGELDLGSLILSAMDLLHRHGLTLPADFTLLVRVLIQLQGLSNTLKVELNPGQLLEPHVRRILAARLDPRRLARDLASVGLRWRQLSQSLPDDLSETLKSLRQGEMTVSFRVHDPDQLTDKVVDGITGAAALLSAAQLISQRTPPMVAGVSVPGAVTVGLGALAWGRMANRRRRGFSMLSAAQSVARLKPRARPAQSRRRAQD